MRERRVRRHSQVSLGREIEKLVKERGQLRMQWEKATVEEREGIHVLSVKCRSRLVALRHAKNTEEEEEQGVCWDSFFRL